MTKTLRLKGIAGSVGHSRAFIGFAGQDALETWSYRTTNNKMTQDSPNLDCEVRGISPYYPLYFGLRKSDAKYWRILEDDPSIDSYLIVSKKDCLIQLDSIAIHNKLTTVGNKTIFVILLDIVSDALHSPPHSKLLDHKKQQHESTIMYFDNDLVSDLARQYPSVVITRLLNNDINSPWQGNLLTSESATSGLRRKASQKMMQKSITSILGQTRLLREKDIDEIYDLILNYWIAVFLVFQFQWKFERKHFITKGLGVYALSQLLIHLINEEYLGEYSVDSFLLILNPLGNKIDWSLKGMPNSRIRGADISEFYSRLVHNLGP